MMNMRDALQECAGHFVLSQNSNSAQQQYIVPATCRAFAGHFPHNPILPAVVQVLMAQMTVENLLGSVTQLFAIHQAKFMAVLVPDMCITVQVQKNGHDNQWDCTVHHGATCASKFRLHLQETAL